MMRGKSFRQAGFTFIELVVVILLLSIVAATIVPKFLDRDGFDEVAYRNEIVSTLRLIQLRSMQQTRNAQCHQVKVTANTIGLLATDAAQTDDCDPNQWHDELRLGYDLDSEDGPTTVVSRINAVSFALSGGSSFSFDGLGRPQGCNPCEIQVIGASTLTVTIESEGYIHAL